VEIVGNILLACTIIFLFASAHVFFPATFSSIPSFLT